MIVRLVMGAGLFALGYFLGKEIGRAEAIRDQLRWDSEKVDRGGRSDRGKDRPSPVGLVPD